MKQRSTRVLVLGLAGKMPFAGVAWQTLHYLEGFRRLGCDVYYIEDNRAWPYDGDPDHTAAYLDRLMTWWGYPDRWAYRDVSRDVRTYGLPATALAHLFDRAEVLVNLHGATELREEHRRVPVRLYVETDPVGPQIEIAKGVSRTIDLLSAHSHWFSYGENLGASDCGVPLQRFHYAPTRQPVILDWWAPAGPPPAGARFTTVASWRQTGRDIEWKGQVYGWSKHVEFLKFLELPQRARQTFELALAGADADAIDQLERYGWRIRDALAVSQDTAPYRAYIKRSRGEFTVGKDQNLRLRSGWFSDRSACYLAAGRPVVAQDTGFGCALPVGRGLFAFETMDDVLAAVDAIAADYARHSAAARGVAEEYFRAEHVVSDLLYQAGF
jgi:hypothetical protein